MAYTIAAVIPVYNKEPYVARAIASVLAQTRPVDEIIIVDDAFHRWRHCTDSGISNARIRLLRRAKSGPGPSRLETWRSALQVGVDCILDADDEWTENSSRS